MPALTDQYDAEIESAPIIEYDPYNLDMNVANNDENKKELLKDYRALYTNPNLLYENLRNFHKLRTEFPLKYREWYEHKDPNLIGYVKLPKYMSVSCRELFVHLQKTLQNLEISKINKSGRQHFTSADNIVYYLSALLSIAVPQIITLLNDVSPKRLIHSKLVDYGLFTVDESLPESQFCLYTDIPPKIIKTMTTMTAFDEGLLIIGLCLYLNPETKDSLYQIFVNHKCPELRYNAEPLAEQIEEDTFEKIMTELNIDIKKLKMKESDIDNEVQTTPINGANTLVDIDLNLDSLEKQKKKKKKKKKNKETESKITAKKQGTPPDFSDKSSGDFGDTGEKDSKILAKECRKLTLPLFLPVNQLIFEKMEEHEITDEMRQEDKSVSNTSKQDVTEGKEIKEKTSRLEEIDKSSQGPLILNNGGNNKDNDEKRNNDNNNKKKKKKKKKKKEEEEEKMMMNSKTNDGDDENEEDEEIEDTDNENKENSLSSQNIFNALYSKNLASTTSAPINAKSSLSVKTDSSSSSLDRGTVQNNEDNGVGNSDEDEYSKFVYDEMDLDPNFIYLVEHLADCFPTFSKTDLKIRLKLTNSVEELIEELFIETELHEIQEQEEFLAQQQLEQQQKQQQQQQQQQQQISSSKYGEEALKLHEIFPQISLPIIAKRLQKNNGDAEMTTMSLLDEPAEAEFTTKQSQNKQNTANEWFQISTMVNRVKSFLDMKNDSLGGHQGGENANKYFLEDEEITYYARKSNGNYFDALTGIIMNCRPKIRKEVIVATTKKKVGGRVQRGGSRLAANRGRTTTEIRVVSTDYKYNPNATESKELWQFYHSNPDMQMLDKTFLINALEFFRGNCDQVLSLAFELAQEKGPSLNSAWSTGINNGLSSKGLKTAPIKFAPKQTTDSYLILAQKFKTYTAKRKASVPLFSSSPPSSSSSSTSASTIIKPSGQIERLNTYIGTGRLDLHNFKLVDAIQTTKLVLSHWWDQEKKHREEQGQLQKFGNLAQFVHDIEIITGRGLHSVGGVSLIRKYVKEYLVRERFVFDEQVGKFDVKGKRK